MDEKEIIRLYVEEKMTLRMVADNFGTNHHRIKRILVKNGIEITQKNRIRKPFSESHKKKISDSRKEAYKSGKYVPYNIGLNNSREHNIKNMVGHIKYDVDFNFYNQFEDLEKIKCLNRMLTRNRVSKFFNTTSYKAFIIKFYYDNQFNLVYNNWIANDKDRWAKPSLDHKRPSSKGGDYSLENLQVLTWFENRAKCDMTQDEWNKFKLETNTKSDYFI